MALIVGCRARGGASLKMEGMQKEDEEKDKGEEEGIGGEGTRQRTGRHLP